MTKNHVLATEQDIRNWLDMQIEAMKIQNTRLVLTEQEYPLLDEVMPDIELINCNGTDYIHVYAPGFVYIAKKLGLPIKVTYREDDPDYRYNAEFVYHDAKFFCILNERMYEEQVKTEG